MASLDAPIAVPPQPTTRKQQTPHAPTPLPHAPAPDGRDAPAAVPRQADPPPPAAEPTQLSRDEILRATATCLRDLGYDGTTIRRIAKLLGCAVGSIYRYFRDKRALLDAVAQQRFEPVALAAESRQPIDAGVRLYAQTALADPPTYRMMFWLTGGLDGADAQLPDVITRIIAAWADRLDNADKARRCWVLVHGAVMTGQSADDAVASVRSLLPTKRPSRRVTPAKPVVVEPDPQTLSASEPSEADTQAEDVCLL